MMAASIGTVPAWALPAPVCIICGEEIAYEKGSEYSTYEEFYKVPSIDGLTSESGYIYRGTTLRIADYNSQSICKECLETKIAEYKATAAHTGSTNINASIESHYTLVVPESVTMTGDDNVDEKTATIPVTVKGNICEDQCVTVATNVTAMQRAGSKDAAATVTAPKTVWNYGDVTASDKEGTTSNYIVKATLSPGDWKGVATFTCTLGNAA